MTFKHKLSRRLALLKDRRVVVATAAIAAAAVFACEKPVSLTDPVTSPAARLVVSPKVLTLPLNQVADFMAVGLTSSGDTANVAVSWSVSSGSVTDTSTSGGKHYGRYKAGSGSGKVNVVATGNPGGTSDTAVVTVTPVPVASVTLSPTSASVQVGGTIQLAAVAKDSSGNILAGRAMTWSSSNSLIATVTSAGLATAIAAGTAMITATSEGQSGTAAIAVTNVPVASVTVSPALASVPIAQTLQLTAILKDASGNTLSGRTVTWTSSNTASATVSSSGVVTGVAAGSATVTATSEGQSGTAAITVTIVPVASVTVSPASGSVLVGQTLQLTATLKDASGNTLTGRTVTWTSSNTAWATVSSSGLVTGAAAGAVTITATSEGKSGTAAITVTNVPVASVTVSPASGSVLVGQTLQLTATLKDAGGNILTGRTVTWTSSNTAWATLSSSGVVTGVAAGSVTVTATSEGQSGTAAIIVTNPAGFSPSCQQTAYLRLVEVATANDLHAALDSARAGDQIHLADGTYDANGWGFAVNVSGTAAHCIKLYGSPAAIIDANSLTGWDGLTLNGPSYWTFEGFTITNALRAVIAFGASHDYFHNLQIHHTGQAGIELKTSSTHNVIEASTIWDTGVAVAVWGEGIYIGTADIGGSDHCDSNAVVGNTMGPNVRAEHIDVKPGSDYGLIRDNAFDGTGEVEQLDNVNSWVSLDGNGWLVQHNSGHNVIRYGMKVEAPGTANLFTNNLIDETAGGDPQKYGFRIEAAAVGNILLCDNQVINADAFRDDGLACQPTASTPGP